MLQNPTSLRPTGKGNFGGVRDALAKRFELVSVRASATRWSAQLAACKRSGKQPSAGYANDDLIRKATDRAKAIKDPYTSARALMCLAAAREKHGQFVEAVTLLTSAGTAAFRIHRQVTRMSLSAQITANLGRLRRSIASGAL